MKLDKQHRAARRATRGSQIRPRSALGLKYIDLQPGHSADQAAARAARSRSTQSLKPIELDEFFSTFRTTSSAANQRTVFEGYGNALAGRGQDINKVIARRCVPFLDAPRAGDARRCRTPTPSCDNFFRQAGPHLGADRAGGRHLRAAVREHGHHVRGAVAPRRAAAQDDRAAAPDARGGHPQLPGAAAVPARHRPSCRAGCEPVAERDRAVAAAAWPTRCDVGTPVQAKAPTLYRHTREVFRSLDDLAPNPNTLLGAARPATHARGGHAAGASTWRPTRPSATTGTTTGPRSREHVSESVPGGTGQRSQPQVGQPHPGQPR